MTVLISARDLTAKGLYAVREAARTAVVAQIPHVKLKVLEDLAPRDLCGADASRWTNPEELDRSSRVLYTHELDADTALALYGVALLDPAPCLTDLAFDWGFLRLSTVKLDVLQIERDANYRFGYFAAPVVFPPGSRLRIWAAADRVVPPREMTFALMGVWAYPEERWLKRYADAMAALTPEQREALERGEFV